MMKESVSTISQLERDIRQAMGAERFRLRRRLRNIKEAQKAGKPFDRNLSKLSRDVEKSVRAAEGSHRRSAGD